MNIIGIGILLGYILIPILSFLFIRSIFTSRKTTKFAIERIDNNFKKMDNSMFSYEKVFKFLKEMGIKAVFGREVVPAEFLLIKLVFSVLFFIAALKVNLIIAILTGVVSFFIPEAILIISNKSDNDDMILDLKKVYDTLRIQTKAGVFLTTALTECYLVVRNERLKDALLELNAYIITWNDVDGAIEEFNTKFKNSHIDTFCIIIKQSIESGKTVQILNDLSAQIKDIEQGLSIKLRESTERKMEILQLLIFCGVTAIIIYGVFSELMNSLIIF